MDLNERYSKLYKTSISKINADNYSIDPLIDSDLDNRFGITLLIRPDIDTQNRTQELLDSFKNIAPNQYYYPSSDLHITILSIISCYDGFDIKKIDLSKYTQLIQKCLVGIKPIKMHQQGITASDASILIQGFFYNNSIRIIRDRLRFEFKNSALEHRIDKRYTIQTAHATIIRFKEKLENKQAFLEFIEENKNFKFGNFTAHTIELVYNDWYQKKQFVKKLHEFKLN